MTIFPWIIGTANLFVFAVLRRTPAGWNLERALLYVLLLLALIVTCTVWRWNVHSSGPPSTVYSPRGWRVLPHWLGFGLGSRDGVFIWSSLAAIVLTLVHGAWLVAAFLGMFD